VRRQRLLLALLVVVLASGGLAWRYQGTLIGLGLRWYLARVSSGEARDGTLERRRAVVAGMHRALLMSRPPDAVVPELFDALTVLGQRMTAGTVPLAWGAYLYTGYFRQLIEQRPEGRPARTFDEVRAALDREAAFYSVGARPGVNGVRFSDVFLPGTDGYTKDEIEAAAREGRTLPLH